MSEGSHNFQNIAKINHVQDRCRVTKSLKTRAGGFAP